MPGLTVLDRLQVAADAIRNTVAAISGASAASPDGTSLPGALQIVDATGAVWTLNRDYRPCKNGVVATNGVVAMLIWYHGAIYGYAAGGWWQENGTSVWTSVGATIPAYDVVRFTLAMQAGVAAGLGGSHV